MTEAETYEGHKADRDVYQGTPVMAKLHEQAIPGVNPPVVLFTDYNGTYDREPREHETAEAIAAESRAITTYLEEKHVPNIVVTGQPSTELGSRWQKRVLEVPPYDIFVVSDGAKILVRQADGAHIPDIEYLEMLHRKFGNDMVKIQAYCGNLIERGKKEWSDSALRFALREGETVAVEGQFSPWTLRFNGPPEIKNSIAPAVRKELDEAGYPNVFAEINAHWKIDGGNNTTWQMKVTPVSKADAINYLLTKLRSQGIFAGNGSNDVQALLGSNITAGIVVGGHDPELGDVIGKLPVLRGNDMRGSRVVQVGDQKKLLWVEPAHTGKLGPGSLIAGLKFFERFAAHQHRLTSVI